MNLKAWTTIAFGVWVMLGGVLRYLEKPESFNALGFGLFCGIMALAGGILLLKNKRLPGLILAGVAVLFVGGYFISKSRNGGDDASLRVLFTIGISVITAIVLCLPAPKNQETPSAAAK